MRQSSTSANPPKKARIAYANGEETNRHIINAAIELFGERGFEAASMRDIARRADVAAPLLSYHFANKEGLYLACADRIHHCAREFFDPSMEEIRLAIAQQASPEALMEKLEALIGLSLDFSLSNEDAARIRPFIAQDQAGNGLGGRPNAMLLEYRLDQMQLFTQLIAALIGRAASDPEVQVRSLSLQGHMNVFTTLRLPVMHGLGLGGFEDSTLERICAVVISNMRILIQAWRHDQR